MLSRRLQVLIDDDRYRRLERESARRKVSVAVLVRDAIDARYPGDAVARQDAARRIRDAEPMPVPSPEGLRAELDEVRGRRG